MKSRTVLVTGATGFLGGAVARHLHHSGWKVLATGRNAAAGSKLANDGIPFTQCHLEADRPMLQSMVNQASHVVHCAALSSPWGKYNEFFQANVIATRNILTACQQAPITRLVAISTPSVSFDFAAQRNLSEDAPWPEPPANHYIATKRQAELEVRAAISQGLPAVILRPKALFGPGDTTLIPRVLKVAARGKFPLFGPDCLLDLTWIDDAVATVTLALTKPAALGNIYHITSGQPLSRQLVLTTLFDACGMQVKFKQLSLPFALRLGSALEFISRCGTLSNWEPPLTRYSVGALGYGQTLDISNARRDLEYAPQTDLLARLRDCGQAWRNRHSAS